MPPTWILCQMTTGSCTSENYPFESSADGLMRDFPVIGLLSKNTIRAGNQSTQVWANLSMSFPLQFYLYCIEKQVLLISDSSFLTQKLLVQQETSELSFAPRLERLQCYLCLHLNVTSWFWCDFTLKMEQNILTFNDILFPHVSPFLYYTSGKWRNFLKNGMLYILLSKQILSVLFILNVLLEAWDSFLVFFKKKFYGYYLNKHIAFIPFWNEAKYIRIA